MEPGLYQFQRVVWAALALSTRVSYKAKVRAFLAFREAAALPDLAPIPVGRYGLFVSPAG